MTKKFILVLIAFVFASVFQLQPAMAQAGFVISPTSLAFEGRQRAGEFVVVNNTNRRVRYFIEPYHMMMQGTGEIVRTETEGSIKAQEMLRYSPRQFELNPQERQVVRVAVRKPANLPRGEYVTYFHIVSEGVDSSGPRIVMDDRETETGNTAAINLRVGRTLRVAIREGVSQGTSTISNLVATARNNTTNVAFDVVRSGEALSEGLFSLTDDAGNVLTNGNIAVLKDINVRRVDFDIDQALQSVCLNYRDLKSRAEFNECINVGR